MADKISEEKANHAEWLGNAIGKALAEGLEKDFAVAAVAMSAHLGALREIALGYPERHGLTAAAYARRYLDLVASLNTTSDAGNQPERGLRGDPGANRTTDDGTRDRSSSSSTTCASLTPKDWQPLRELIDLWRAEAAELLDTGGEPDDTMGRDKARSDTYVKCARQVEKLLPALSTP
jgi:hypothetical protein